MNMNMNEIEQCEVKLFVFTAFQQLFRLRNVDTWCMLDALSPKLNEKRAGSYKGRIVSPSLPSSPSASSHFNFFNFYCDADEW